MNRWVKLSFAVLAISSLLGTLLFRVRMCDDSQTQKGQALLEPRTLTGLAPEFGLATIAGAQFNLSDYRGKYVLVNFWATWCEPCIQELPHLGALAEKLSDLPVVLVLVSVDENWSEIGKLAHSIEKSHSKSTRAASLMKVARMLKGGMPNVKMLLDQQERTAREYGTSRYPETYLIGPKGRLLRKFIGPKSWHTAPAVEYLRDMLESVK